LILRFHRYGSHILEAPPLVPRLGDKFTPSPKSRSHILSFCPEYPQNWKNIMLLN
jgi:hypothetical protein